MNQHKIKFLAGSARNSLCLGPNLTKMAHTYFGFLFHIISSCLLYYGGVNVHMPVFERGLALPLVSRVISD